METSVFRLLARLHRDRRGATLVEFTIVMGVFLGITFMLFEFGFALYQWVATEKATQLGARLAAVRNAAPALPASFSIAGAEFTFGDRCLDGACAAVATVTCTNGAGCNADTYDRIEQAMLAVAPFLTPGGNCDVVIEYRQNPALGFVGGPFVGEVEVSIQNYTFQFVTLQAFSTFLGNRLSNALPMPTKSTTIVTEDLNSSGA